MSTLIFEMDDGTRVVTYAGPENTRSDTRMRAQIGDGRSLSAENALALGTALQAWARSVLDRPLLVLPACIGVTAQCPAGKHGATTHVICGNCAEENMSLPWGK